MVDEVKVAILRVLGFDKAIENLDKGCCPICGDPVDPNGLRDALSIKEFEISGLCQVCQDTVFTDNS